MPRTSRLILSGYAHHVMQNALFGQCVFVDSYDYRQYLINLDRCRRAFNIHVIAYCLLPTGVHLLLVPNDAVGLAKMMKVLSCEATRLANRRLQRCGALWSSRFHSSPVQDETFLLPCIRYIEQLPINCGVAFRAEDYAWSSCAYRLHHSGNFAVDEHHGFALLAGSSYREYLMSPINSIQQKIITEAVLRDQLTGDESFQHKVERLSGRRVAFRGQGRPRKSASSGNANNSSVMPSARNEDCCRRIEQDIINYFSVVLAQ